ncbi:MAG: sigma-70 family RNA polymerase sigma factor [Armatimonadetes bacterium]|nr:sigma-70 family RNA polymerase sigma factor [Armatimonadota bacterium]MCA1997874.1 sigma-70 family RNA polymerase sigma factor [Armatimonadota bacterium]
MAAGETVLDADGYDVERARDGDPSAFDRLFSRHFARVYRFAYRMSGDAELAEDAAQGAFVRSYRALGGIRDGQSFVKYLYRAALNLLKDEARRRSRKPEASMDGLERAEGGSAGPEGSLAVRERDAALHRAVLALPEEFRTVLVLHHFEEMDVEEIGRVLGIPEGTVKSRLGRARARLREQLREWLVG